ncbi:MAG: hypothetical protein IPL10_15855 [Bacteroidetes bacterium]|nr:hypothetical protein [Bacteroidota bacterium]
MKEQSKLCFQPGEEVLPGGSSLMIKEGVLQNPKVDVAMAQHVFQVWKLAKLVLGGHVHGQYG